MNDQGLRWDGQYRVVALKFPDSTRYAVQKATGRPSDLSVEWVQVDVKKRPRGFMLLSSAVELADILYNQVPLTVEVVRE